MLFLHTVYASCLERSHPTSQAPLPWPRVFTPSALSGRPVLSEPPFPHSRGTPVPALPGCMPRGSSPGLPEPEFPAETRPFYRAAPDGGSRSRARSVCRTVPAAARLSRRKGSSRAQEPCPLVRARTRRRGHLARGTCSTHSAQKTLRE